MNTNSSIDLNAQEEGLLQTEFSRLLEDNTAMPYLERTRMAEAMLRVAKAHLSPPVCTLSRFGWYCTRVHGHDAPCDAPPVASLTAQPAEVQRPFEKIAQLATPRASVDNLASVRSGLKAAVKALAARKD